GHDAPDPLRQRLQQRRLQEPELDSDDAEADSDRRQRERHRVADQQHDDERREHQRRDVLDEKRGHGFSTRPLASATSSWAISFSPCARRISSASSSSAVFATIFSPGSGIIPARNAMRLMSSDKPWRISRKKPTGTMSRAGQMMRPPA